MATLYVNRNGTDWVLDTSGGEGPSGPAWGFDTDTGRPVFKTPDGTCYVFADGTTVPNTIVDAMLDFTLPQNGVHYFFFF